MNRQFEIGDRVVCKESGVIGKILRFYVPTACDEQIDISYKETIERLNYFNRREMYVNE